MFFFSFYFNSQFSAQKLPLSDFVIYAGSDTASLTLQQLSNINFGVQINGNSKVLSGKVGSTSYISTAGPVSIYNGLFSGGIIAAWLEQYS